MRTIIISKKFKSISSQLFFHIIPFGLLFLFWEILARTVLATYEFPPFSAVVQAISSSLIYHLGVTLAFSFLELLMISLVGLSFGTLIYRSEKLKWAITPVFWFMIFGIGTAIVIKAPIFIVLFGLSKGLIVLQSILVPLLLVALISGSGHKMLAIKIGYLLCLLFQIMGEMIFGATDRGIGVMLFQNYHLHNMVALYAALLLVGSAGVFVEEVVLGYVGNKLKIE
ncbi:hypothetical protein LI82_06100 [Methanococcoides methylutens]|uniref:ABC transmembrane type-1 domain-containing protein n=1 Tax=Methanococcoides methylutens TaxID=2226 RepID=A0A099T3Q2_METMT|nr:hypothetical protein [Methanococcoides methylutens]KGK98861.1 hypothetical protein LI82_06100 [Methanococcoides methylutens]